MNPTCSRCGKLLLDDEEVVCYGCTLTQEDVMADVMRAAEEAEEEDGDWSICPDCGRPTVWDESLGSWVHETSNPNCFLSQRPE